MISFYSKLNRLINRPSKGTNDALRFVQAFNSFKYGWYFALPWYFEYWDPVPGYGDTVSQAGAYDVRTQFNKSNVIDWATIADQALGAGIDYVTLMAKNGRGFRYWDSQSLKNFNGGYTYNGAIIPWYGNDYSIANSAVGYTNTFLQNAIDVFKARGIYVGLYYSIGEDINIRTRITSTDATIGGASFYSRYDEYMALVIDEITELFNAFSNFDFIWADNASVRYPMLDGNGSDTRYQNYQNLYNIFKNYKKAVITNIYLGIDPTNSENSNSFSYNGKLKYFPQDIISMEWVNDDNLANKSEYAAQVVHDGTNYYIPKEYLYSGIYRIDEGAVEQVQYPWLDNSTGYFNNQSINQIKSQETFQNQYDYARSQQLVFNCNVPIRHNSNDIDPTYLSRLQNIVL